MDLSDLNNVFNRELGKPVFLYLIKRGIVAKQYIEMWVKESIKSECDIVMMSIESLKLNEKTMN